MTPFLLRFLCEPVTKEPLALIDATHDSEGNIVSGTLVTIAGKPLCVIEGETAAC